MKKYKIGQQIEFICLGAKTLGVIEKIDQKNKSLYIEANGLKYPNVLCISQLPKKGQNPPWYIIDWYIVYAKT